MKKDGQSMLMYRYRELHLLHQAESIVADNTASTLLGGGGNSNMYIHLVTSFSIHYIPSRKKK